MTKTPKEIACENPCAYCSKIPTVEVQEKHMELLPRLKRISGQVNGLIRMVEGGKGCEAILTQILAVQGALRTIGKLVLQDHLTHCVKDGIEKGENYVMEEFNNILAKFIN